MGHHQRETYSHHEDPQHEPPHHEPVHRDPHQPPVHQQSGHHSKCFIATAVHGENSIEVLTLRKFRDQTLSATALGRAFIAIYTRSSPPLAAFIAEKPRLRNLAERLIVKPAYSFALRRAGSDATASSEARDL